VSQYDATFSCSCTVAICMACSDYLMQQQQWLDWRVWLSVWACPSTIEKWWSSYHARAEFRQSSIPAFKHGKSQSMVANFRLDKTSLGKYIVNMTSPKNFIALFFTVVESHWVYFVTSLSNWGMLKHLTTLLSPITAAARGGSIGCNRGVTATSQSILRELRLCYNL
jgi:hypothetical protein